MLPISAVNTSIFEGAARFEPGCNIPVQAIEGFGGVDVSVVHVRR